MQRPERSGRLGAGGGAEERTESSYQRPDLPQPGQSNSYTLL